MREDERIRKDRVVRMWVMDSCRPAVMIELAAIDKGARFGRWRVSVNGKRIGRRRFGATGVAELIAAWLR